MFFLRKTLLLFLSLSSRFLYAQQDINLYVSDHFLSGQKILKVYKNNTSQYVFGLGQHNKIYRINSTAKTVADLSSQFSIYNNYQFTDIVSPDDITLFIATNTSKVIFFQNGVVGSIGTADGLLGNVNSIGLFLSTSYFQYGNANTLRIGTDQGFALYDIINRSLTFYKDTQPGVIFNLDYRSGIYQNSTGQASSNPDLVSIDINTYSLVTKLTIVGGYIWRNGIYGQPNTAYYTFPDLYLTNDTNYLLYLFWGSDQGLFENRVVTSSSQAEIKNYLTGISINKISNILGLTSLGSKFFRNNLLVGTKTGLYFSNSTVNSSVVPVDLTFTYLTQLGNISVNDITTSIENIDQVTPLVDCEDGAWLATDNGVYAVKSDYTPVLSTPVSAISFQNQTTINDTLTVCTVENIKAVIDTSVIHDNSIQWFKDGKAITQATTQELLITEPGSYNAVLFDPCENVHIQTNHLVVQLTPSPVFTFNYPSTMNFCYGTVETLHVLSAAMYHYKWYKNSQLLPDTTSSLIVTEEGIYYVEVSACPYEVVSSKTVSVKFLKLPVPVISTDKSGYCFGDQAILSINIPVSHDYTINWQKDGIALPTDINQKEITTNSPGNYIASIMSTLPNTDGSFCSQSSTSVPLVFELPPIVTITQTVTTTLCTGQAIYLTAHYINGSVNWSTGETTDQITVTQSGTYKVTVTSKAGCQSDTSINVAFLPNPIFTTNDTSICSTKKQLITLTAPAGFSAYDWNNGESNSLTYLVSKPETVNLTVTDMNGCRATHQIKIIDQCPTVIIPNSFTPNGDGINDTWEIQGLDASATVKVFTRWGSMIYHNSGYFISWSGEFDGKRVASGVYYYVISNKGGQQKFSGSLTIVY